MSTNVCASLENPIAHQSYRHLPTDLFRESDPTPSSKPSLIELNYGLLKQLGIDASWFRSDTGLSVMAGNVVNQQNRSLAMAYSGHQFGHWVPVLGDGRAHMLGQLAAADGSMFDVQLKGSGRTPYSRGGDGRATLGSVLREYVISEAMAGLGISTTRSIAVIATGDDIYRDRSLPGAILVRSASSHVRVGTFQYAASTLGVEGIKALADFVIANHFPELQESPEQLNQYLGLLAAVVERQASLIAQWMLVGFIHGVMNTDNMSIIGETIDYGPCAFMDEFHPGKVFSSIDRSGRYAWDKQPGIAAWNLTRFAETLLPLLHESENKAVDRAKALIEEFAPLFREKYQTGLRQKLGLTASTEALTTFGESTLAMLAETGVDFTVFFDRLTGVAAGDADELLLELFSNEQTGVAWLKRWHSHRAKGATMLTTMRQANPAVIARNHRVEEAIIAANDNNDLTPFRRLCRVVANPYELDPEEQELQTPPRPERRVTQTFCGT